MGGMGCGEDKGTRIRRAYEEDIAKALSVPVSDLIVDVLSYPQKRDLFLEPVEVSISFNEFLSLNECGLRQLIAERNDQLGKVMPMSRLLVYEHQLLKQALQCRRKLSEDHPLAQKLDEIIIAKRENLPRAFWNATFASNEFRGQFSLATSKTENPFPEVLDQALGYFVTLHAFFGHEKYDLGLGEVERAYEVIEVQDNGLLPAVVQLTQTLERVTWMIESRLQNGDIGEKSIEASKLRQAFVNYYVKFIQPDLSRTHGDARGWFEQMNQLAHLQTDIMPDAFQTYYQQQLDMTSDAGLWQRFDGAVRSHTNVWQTVLDQTGGMPNR